MAADPIFPRVGKEQPRIVTYWSYSSWHTWHQCAFKWYRCRVMGDKEPMGPAVARGNAVHALAESYLKGKIYGGMPPPLRKLASHYVALRKLRPIVEEYWSVNQFWKPTTGKGEDGKWCVMKMDAALPPHVNDDGKRVIYIQDLKTGREYGSHDKQASLYACIGATRYRDLDGVDVEFWYSDSGETTHTFYNKRAIATLTKYWRAQGEAMMNPAQDFLPNPSVDACKWCFLRTDKGGPCKAWKTVRGL